MVKLKLVNGLPNSSSFGGEVCEGCQFEKAHRLSFDKSTCQWKAPLEVIHSDLMGPIRIPSFSKHSYMLAFIDDYSIFTWVYFVKPKSKVFNKCLEFKELLEGVLSCKIKWL